MKQFLVLILMVIFLTGCGSVPLQTQGADSESPAQVDDSPSAAPGRTRAKPILLGDQATTPEWNIRVKEFLRGADALGIIREDAPDTPEAPAGFEYAIANIEIRCLAIDQNYHSISLSEMYMTGNHSLAYKDTMDEIPAPEFLYKDLFTAETATGWVDALIPVDEEGLILVYDRFETEDVRTTLYFELQPGAAFAVPDLEKIKPTDLGATQEEPLKLGETAVNENWQMRILEVVDGEEALRILKDEASSELEVGMEYALVRLWLKYISTDETPFSVSEYMFHSLDLNGTEYYSSDVNFSRPYQRDWLTGTLLPSAEVEGWVALKFDAGASGKLLLFTPEPYDSGIQFESLRYFSLEK